MKGDNVYTPDGISVARAAPAVFAVSASSAQLNVSHGAGNAGAKNASVLPALPCPPLSLNISHAASTARARIDSMLSVNACSPPHLRTSVSVVVNENEAPPEDPPPVSVTPRAPALSLASVISTRTRDMSWVSAGVSGPPFE